MREKIKKKACSKSILQYPKGGKWTELRLRKNEGEVYSMPELVEELTKQARRQIAQFWSSDEVQIEQVLPVLERSRYTRLARMQQSSPPDALYYPLCTFHGTPRLEIAQRIAACGYRQAGELDPETGAPIARSHGRMYGEGVYTSVDPSLALAYAECGDAADPERAVLVFNLVFMGVTHILASAADISAARENYASVHGRFCGEIHTRATPNLHYVVSAASDYVVPALLLVLRSPKAYVSRHQHMPRLQQPVMDRSECTDRTAVLFRKLWRRDEDGAAVYYVHPTEQDLAPQTRLSVLIVAPQDVLRQHPETTRALVAVLQPLLAQKADVTLVLYSAHDGVLAPIRVESAEAVEAVVFRRNGPESLSAQGTGLRSVVLRALVAALSELRRNPSYSASQVLWLWLWSDRADDEGAAADRLTAIAREEWPPGRLLAVKLLLMSRQEDDRPELERLGSWGRLKVELQAHGHDASLPYESQFASFVSLEGVGELSIRLTESAQRQLREVENWAPRRRLQVPPSDAYVGDGFVRSLWAIPEHSGRGGQLFRGIPPPYMLGEDGSVLRTVVVDGLEECALALRLPDSLRGPLRRRLTELVQQANTTRQQLQREYGSASAAAYVKLKFRRMAGDIDAFRAVNALVAQFVAHALYSGEPMRVRWYSPVALAWMESALQALHARMQWMVWLEDEDPCSGGGGGKSLAEKRRLQKQLRSTSLALARSASLLTDAARIAAQPGPLVADLLQRRHARKVVRRLEKHKSAQAFSPKHKSHKQVQTSPTFSEEEEEEEGFRGMGLRVGRSEASVVDPWRIRVEVVSLDEAELTMGRAMACAEAGVEHLDAQGARVTDPLLPMPGGHSGDDEERLKEAYGWVFARNSLVYLPEQPAALLLAAWAALGESCMRVAAAKASRHELQRPVQRWVQLTRRVVRFAASDTAAMGEAFHRMGEAHTDEMQCKALGLRVFSTSLPRYVAQWYVRGGPHDRMAREGAALMADSVAQSVRDYMRARRMDAGALLRSVFSLHEARDVRNPWAFSRPRALKTTAALFRAARGCSAASPLALGALWTALRQLEGRPFDEWADEEVEQRWLDALESGGIGMRAFLTEHYPGEPGGRVEVALVVYGARAPRRWQRAQGPPFRGAVEEIREALEREAASAGKRLSALGKAKDRDERRIAAAREFMRLHVGAPRLFSQADVERLCAERPAEGPWIRTPEGLLWHHCCYESCPDFLRRFFNEHDRTSGLRTALFDHLEPMSQLHLYIPGAHRNLFMVAWNSTSKDSFIFSQRSLLPLHRDFLVDFYDQCESLKKRLKE